MWPTVSVVTTESRSVGIRRDGTYASTPHPYEFSYIHHRGQGT